MKVVPEEEIKFLRSFHMHSVSNARIDIGTYKYGGMAPAGCYVWYYLMYVGFPDREPVWFYLNDNGRTPKELRQGYSSWEIDAAYWKHMYYALLEQQKS